MTTRLPVLLLLLAAVGCGGGSTTSGPGLEYGDHTVPDTGGGIPDGSLPGGGSFPSLQGGVLVTLESAGETWRWWVTNPTTARLLVERWNGTQTPQPISGLLRGGPGAASHNAPWSWHLDPDPRGDALTIPDPPLTPSRAENELDLWLPLNAVFEPPNTRIIGLQDRR